MATMELDRSRLWEVSSRVIVYAAIGAALYGVLGWLINVPLPGSNNVSIRPAFALVPFFGWAFGPIVGLFTGLVGNALLDQLSGYGLLTAWNWSIAVGLVGLLAGVLAASPIARLGANKIIGAAVIGVLSTIIGLLFVFTDIVVFGNSFQTALTGSYGFAVVPDVIAAAIFVPILAAAWDPLRESLGR
jgi:energy-coupling factor transport system substrate-specific component